MTTKNRAGVRSFDPKKDVHRHLIRTPGKEVPAHVPWRRMHGLDANGFRSGPAHSNKHVVLLVTGARKLRFESASQQFGHHEMLSRGFCGIGILSSPPLLFVCGLAHCVVRPNGYAILSLSDRAIWRSKAEGCPYCAGAVAAGAVASGFSPVRRSWRRSWRPWRRSWRWVRRPCRRCIPCVPVASAGAAAVPAASCASASNGSNAADSVKPNAAPSPSREIAFRREIISVLIFRSLAVSLSLTIAELEWRQLNAITSMSGRRKFVEFDGVGCGSPLDACSRVSDGGVG